VLFGAEHRLQQRLLNLQSVLRFQDARIAISISNRCQTGGTHVVTTVRYI
jgi:hypothetical protein